MPVMPTSRMPAGISGQILRCASRYRSIRPGSSTRSRVRTNRCIVYGVWVMSIGRYYVSVMQCQICGVAFCFSKSDDKYTTFCAGTVQDSAIFNRIGEIRVIRLNLTVWKSLTPWRLDVLAVTLPIVQC